MFNFFFENFQSVFSVRMFKLNSTHLASLQKLAILLPTLSGLRWYIIKKDENDLKKVHFHKFGFFMSVFQTMLGGFTVYFMLNQEGLSSTKLRSSAITNLGDSVLRGLNLTRVLITIIPVWIFCAQRKKSFELTAAVDNKLEATLGAPFDSFGLRVFVHSGTLILFYMSLQCVKLYYVVDLTAMYGQDLNLSVILRLVSNIAYTFVTIYEFTILLIFIGRRMNLIYDVLKKIN